MIRFFYEYSKVWTKHFFWLHRCKFWKHKPIFYYPLVSYFFVFYIVCHLVPQSPDLYIIFAQYFYAKTGPLWRGDTVAGGERLHQHHPPPQHQGHRGQLLLSLLCWMFTDNSCRLFFCFVVVSNVVLMLVKIIIT